MIPYYKCVIRCIIHDEGFILHLFFIFKITASLVNVEVLKKYMKEKVFARLSDDEDEVKPFSVVYMHTGAGWRQNFPGIMVSRSIYHAIPVNIKKSLQVIYFIHPDLQSRLFMATFGRLFFTQE